MIPIGVKKTLQNKSFLLQRQFSRRHFGQDPIEVFGTVQGIIIQLADQ